MMMHKEAAATKRLVDRIGATRDLAILRQEQAFARRRTPEEQAALTNASLTAKGKYEVERINSAFSAGEIALYRDANDGLSPGAAVARMKKDPTKDEDIAHTRYFYNRGNPRKMTSVHTIPLTEEQRDFANRVLQGQAASQTDKQYIEGYARSLSSVRYSSTVKPFIEPDQATGKIRLPGGVQHPNPSLALRLEDLYKSYTTATGDKTRGEILAQMQEVQTAILSNPTVTGRAITENTMRYMKDVFIANNDKLLPVLLASTIAAGVKSNDQKRAIAGAVEVLKTHPWENPVALVEAVSRGLMSGVLDPSDKYTLRGPGLGYSEEIIPPMEAKDKALKLVTKAMEQVDSYTGSAITGTGGFDLPALLTYTTQQVRVQTFFERLGLAGLFHDAPPPMPAPYKASTSGKLPPSPPPPPPPIEIGKPATLYAR
jgi:U5 snRNP spliceosome subunit